jgi:hypothetical protein
VVIIYIKTMSEFKKERIVHKMSWEIGNMMKLNSSDCEEVETLLTRMSKRKTERTVIYDVQKLYKWIGKLGVKPKTRRGIFYKVDVIIRHNETLMKNIPEVTWEKIK